MGSGLVNLIQDKLRNDYAGFFVNVEFLGSFQREKNRDHVNYLRNQLTGLLDLNS